MKHTKRITTLMIRMKIRSSRLRDTKTLPLGTAPEPAGRYRFCSFLRSFTELTVRRSFDGHGKAYGLHEWRAAPCRINSIIWWIYIKEGSNFLMSQMQIQSAYWRCWNLSWCWSSFPPSRSRRLKQLFLEFTSGISRIHTYFLKMYAVDLRTPGATR